MAVGDFKAANNQFINANDNQKDKQDNHKQKN
jgi:hypothetical protein